MRVLKENSVGLVIDIQERLLPHIDDYKKLIENVAILLQGFRVLEIPLLVTEQYRKGLGPTVGEVVSHIPAFAPIEKMSFSCCDDTGFHGTLKELGKQNVIICGIETHVCVLQTTLDLIDAGFQPIVVRDCVSSRKSQDKAIAIDRMRQEGAIITTYESILFELVRVSGTDTFKAISKLVK